MDNFDLKKYLAEGKLLKEQTVAIDLSWEEFQEKFPQVKDDNLAGEVYSIMQDQGDFDGKDDEDVVEFMNAASTWTEAEDVADYFDEPASDIGRLIASYYQEESGYEDYDDQWDNYLDYLFDQTEREGDDIDDWRIDEGKIHLSKYDKGKLNENEDDSYYIDEIKRDLEELDDKEANEYLEDLAKAILKLKR